MSVWFIGQLRIHDPIGYGEYSSRVMSTFKKYGGTLICLSDAVEEVEGKWDGARTVVVKFKDRDAAMKWYDSPEYQEIIPLRKKAADGNLIIIENQLKE